MKKIYSSFIFSFLFFALFLSGCSDDFDIETLEDFESYIDDEMDYQNIPALSVLIFNGDKILYEEYFGKSNLKENIALKNDHLFLLASISKVITATALLQLVEKGKLKLDDKINDYLPFKVSIPGYSTEITFRMLLTHTSGIADNYLVLDKHYYYGKDSPISLSSFLKDYLVKGGKYYDASDNFYDFKPGIEYEYSNIGNALIALLVEEISGKDFNTYCKQNIFEPLEMKNTFWRLDEISQTIVTPYDFQKGKNKAIENYTFTDYPNGGLMSTSRDLFQFLIAFTQGGKSNNYQLLKESTINSMITPQIPSIDKEVGLHLFLMDKKNNLWGHDGGEQGVATIMAFNPINKVGAIILTNQGEADLDEMLIEAYKIGLKL